MSGGCYLYIAITGEGAATVPVTGGATGGAVGSPAITTPIILTPTFGSGIFMLRPGVKKQGREKGYGSRSKPGWKDRSGYRREKLPKKHTPSGKGTKGRKYGSNGRSNIWFYFLNDLWDED